LFRQVLAKICFRKLTKAVFACTIKQGLTSIERLHQKVSGPGDLVLSRCTLSVAEKQGVFSPDKIRVRLNVSPASGVTEKRQQGFFLQVGCAGWKGQKYGQLIRFAGIKERHFRYATNG
jgi:hypothetical protein